MVQKISALIVQPTLDASKYTPGAQEKVAADKAMAASSREASAAAVDTSAKISTGGDVLARLSRQYVEGYATQQRFTQGLNQLDRGLQTGKISMEGAERILIGMNQRLGLTANAAELAAKGQMTLASAVERANVQIARQANDLAAADAANRRMQAANSNVISAEAKRAAGFNAGQQIQDIAMMSLVGQSPGVLALQQGPQLATAIQQGGGLAALGAGLTSLLSVTMLLTVGFTAATAATIQWFMKGKDGAKSLDDALKAHSETLRLLKGQYGELGEVAKTIGNAGGLAFTEASARNAQTLIEAQLRQQQQPFLAALTGSDAWYQKVLGRTTGSGALEQLKNLAGDQKLFAGPVEELLRSVRDGKRGLDDFDVSVEKTFSRFLPGSENPAALRATADAVKALGVTAFDVSGKFAAFADPINRLKLQGAQGIATFNAEVEKIGRNQGIQSLADEAIVAGREFVSLTDRAKELERVLHRIELDNFRPGLGDRRELGSYLGQRRSELYSINAQFEADQQMARARTNAERLAAVEAQVRARSREEGDKGGGLQARVDRALEAERNRHAIELRDLTDDRHRSQLRILESGKEELSLIGATANESARLTYQYSELARLKEEAEKRNGPGGVISSEEEARVKRVAEDLGRMAEARARLNLVNENIFNRGQFFRSPLEQQIAARQRGAGLPLDMNSPEAMQMRQLDRMERVYSAGMNFWNDFERGVRSGDDIGKAFVNAFRNAMMEELADVAKTAFSNFLKAGIAAVFPSAGAPAVSGGSIVGSLLGGANDNYAPGAVTRSPLPNVGDGSTYSVANATNFIRQYSSAIGIDPNTALKVARSEGLGAGIWQGNYVKNGFREPSYGPFQLLKGGSGTGFPTGLGNKFMAHTGLDPANPSNWQQSTAFALDQAKANGWGAWYGAKAQGITGFDGIDRSATRAVGALDKLATGSTSAAKGLDNLGGGLGKLGGALNQYPAAPANGGLLGGLLGGGLNSIFAGSKAFNYLSANPGGFVGLYHTGGIAGSPSQMRYVDRALFMHAPRYHSGGIAGDEVPAILKRGEPVFRSMEHARQVVGGGNGGGIADVRVYVDQDGNWQARVEKISEGPARQEAGKAVGNYAYRQSNGGAKADDHRYQRLKRRA